MDTKHSFLKGMNRDVSKDKFPNDAYYYLLNGRILTDDDATMSDIINLKSNTNASIDDNGNDRSGYVIIGYATIQNDIVLFYAEENTIVDSDLTYAAIDVLEYLGNNQYLRVNKWNRQGLNLRSDKKIRAVVRYEAEDIQKVYWTDNNESIRHINIGGSTLGLDPNEFDFLGDFYDTPQMHFESYTSGNIKQGLIHYAYRYVKVNGYKTLFSQISLPISIGRDINYGKIIREIKGDPVYDVDNAYNTGIGVRLRVGVDSWYLDMYDYIEVVSLWYSSKDAVPDVTIISRAELILGKTTYYFIDEGTSNYGTLEYSQFLEQQNAFTAKDIVSKDNRLFVGNITEEFFDLDEALGTYWDGRAYRFTDTLGGPLAILRDGSYVVHDTLDASGLPGTPPDYASIDETEDCLNVFNRVTEDSGEEEESTYLQKYQEDGVTLGGSGLNIKYNFSVLEYYTSSLSQTNPSIDGSIENEHQLGLIRGFQREEVYRFGIVFFDNKGRQSFVKWIGDIRMPSIIDTGAVTTFNSGTSRVTVKTVYVEFELINTPVISGQNLDWQIVYVKREENDKSVVYAGMFSAGVGASVTEARAAMQLGDINKYTTNPGSPTYNKQNVLVMSPDIVFKKTDYLNTDFLHAVGDLTEEWPIYKDRSDTVWNWNQGGPIYDGTNVYINVRRFPTLSPIATEGRNDIVATVKAVPPSSLAFSVPLGIQTYQHATALDPDARAGGHGTAMVHQITGDLPSDTSTGFYYGYGRKVVYDSQYGGQIYENRSANVYVPAGRRDEAYNGSTMICTRGDTFIALFEYLRIIQEPLLWGKEQSEWVQFACESSINILLRHDDPYHKNFFLDPIIPTYINEKPYLDLDSGLYFQELYKYNFVYSNINDSKKFFSKPLSFVNYEEQITKVKYSDVKLNIEDHDSWLSFRTNNFNEAHNNYGPVNRLVNFYDKVFCFQDNGVSLISINPRVTQQSEDGVTITLGTGSVIDKFHYLTTDIGCQDNSDVIKSFSAMYWLDKNKKKIYTYNGKIESVTDLKGMHSYLKNNVYEDSYFIGTYDIHNSEVIMTLYDNISPNSEFIMTDYAFGDDRLTGDADSLDYNFVAGNVYEFTDGTNHGWYMYTGRDQYGIYLTFSHGTQIPYDNYVDLHAFMTERDNFTLAYNEKVQVFTSFYSFVPDLYISHNRDFFTSTNSRDLWQHNIGTNFNEFYGIAYPLQLKLLSNYGSQLQGEFTNFKYFMTVKDTDEEYQRNETFTNIHVKNEYQETTDIILYPMHLPNDVDRSRYVLDTSSIRIGEDWYSGLATPYEGLRVYQNELYRCINLSGHVGPPTVGTDWVIAELANIRKTIEHWIGQMPRYEHREDVYDTVNLTSDRLRANWIETTFEYRSVLSTINIEERELKISDIILSSNPLLF